MRTSRALLSQAALGALLGCPASLLPEARRLPGGVPCLLPSLPPFCPPLSSLSSLVANLAVAWTAHKMERTLLAKLLEQHGPAGLYRVALDGGLPVGELLAEMGAALGYKPLPELLPEPPPQELPPLHLLLDNANSVSGPLALRAGSLAALAGPAGGEAAGSRPVSGLAGGTLPAHPQWPPRTRPDAAAPAGQTRSFEELLASPADAAAVAAAAAVPPSPQLIPSPQAQQAAARSLTRRPPLSPGLPRAGSLPVGRAGQAPSPLLRRSASAAVPAAPAVAAALPGLPRSGSAAGSAGVPSPRPHPRRVAAAVPLPLRLGQLHKAAALQADRLAADRPLAAGLQAGASAFVRLRPRASSSLIW